MSETRGQGSLFLSGSEPAAQKAPAAGSAPEPDQPEATTASRTRKASSGDSNTAERMAKMQREISVSEFFTKNRHLLGFDSPRKALLTAVKEAVDNSLDACEEARILPEIHVEIRKVTTRDNTFTLIVEDNGPGIVKAQVPHIFGRLLYGSKFHRLRQSRGQQGIGISAAGMYSQLTTGNAMRITSRAGKRAIPHFFEVRIDTSKNRPDFTEKAIEWDKPHGTRIEIDLEGEYRRGQRSVDEFLKLCAVANPHVRITYKDPDNNEFTYAAATKELPAETEAIKPHPHGVELGMLIKMAQDCEQRVMTAFLQDEFSRVGPKVAKEILDRAKISYKAHPKRIAKEDADRLKKAIDETRIKAPPTSCIAPIGEAQILNGLQKEVEADFYAACTRTPAVYRGNPFAIEVGIAFGRPGDTMDVSAEGKITESDKKKRRNREEDTNLMGFADEPVRLIRFANRVPLLFQQSACAITKAVIGTDWRRYGLNQPKGGLPVGPMVIMVHIASVWVPFTSESQEASASYDEILKDLRLGLMECGRRLGIHVRKGKRIATEFKKRNYIETYIPHIGEALRDILHLDEAAVTKTVANLTDVLERSRKI